ncbi:hypothetical protein C2I36_10905 [Rhodobacteraceae bacterium WD3A24]|nr:hypothetical protein C2I36_10905 [Rhodobacteraceae bacterium WD3A24]
MTTPLDSARAAMDAAPDDDAARLAFYARIADGELLLLLEEEARDDRLSPRVFPLDSGPVVLLFDSEERLAAFAGAAVPYAALPGRVLARMLAGQGLGAGLNLGVAPSSALLPPEAMDWLAGMVAEAPREITARPRALHPPEGLPEALLVELDGRLARAAGLAEAAWLARVEYEDGTEGHLLAFAGAYEGTGRTLAQAVGEAARFCGLDDGTLDVAFPSAHDPLLERIARVGLRFDLPAPPAAPAPEPPPGHDPRKPPKLR